MRFFFYFGTIQNDKQKYNLKIAQYIIITKNILKLISLYEILTIKKFP